MKKYKFIILIFIVVLSLFICCACDDSDDDKSDDEISNEENEGNEELPEEPFVGMRINKNKFTLEESIDVEVVGFNSKYYLGIFSILSEPGKTSAYIRKTISEDTNNYTFSVKKLRGSGEYVIYLYSRYNNEVFGRAEIQIMDEDMENYKPITGKFSSMKSGSIISSQVSITPSSEKKLTYSLYWTKDKVRLDSYTMIEKVVHEGSDIFTINFNNQMFMPNEANGIEVSILEGRSESLFIDIDNETKQNLSIPESKHLFDFQVLSDLHLNGKYEFMHHANHLRTALNDTKEIYPNSKGVFTVGDNSNFASEGEYVYLNELVNEILGGTTIEMNYALGNHEYQYYDTYEEAMEMYKKYTGMPGAYYSKTIDGNKFIVLGSQTKTTHGEINDEQFNWLENELKSSDSNKSIFIFMHQGLYNTVCGTLPGDDWHGMRNVTNKLRALFDKYSNLYVFNGHSHWSVDNAGTLLYGDDKTASYINAGSMGYIWNEKHEEEVGGEGIFIEVYEDYILVKARHFVEGRWISASQFILFKNY